MQGVLPMASGTAEQQGFNKATRLSDCSMISSSWRGCVCDFMAVQIEKLTLEYSLVCWVHGKGKGKGGK